MARYCFSGHETFTCKALWLKKGFDHLLLGYSFLDADAVVKLGVGKNMVSSIRFWSKAFGMTINDRPTPIAHYLFDDNGGRDPFAEDLNTLWILHYQLVTSRVASLYGLLFLDLQRELKTFDREQLLAYVKRRCSVPEQKNVYNENTVKKDIGVLLANYVLPDSKKSLEDFSALLLDLNLIRKMSQEGQKYTFGQTRAEQIAPEVILYALVDYAERSGTKLLSLDQLTELSLIFCMSLPELIITLRQLVKEYPTQLDYQDNAGVKNIIFKGEPLEKEEVLDKYYKKGQQL